MHCVKACYCLVGARRIADVASLDELSGMYVPAIVCSPPNHQAYDILPPQRISRLPEPLLGPNKSLNGRELLRFKIYTSLEIQALRPLGSEAEAL